MSDLEPIEPREAIELYLDHRETDLSDKSLENQRYRLGSFVEFCEENDIENLNELTGRNLHEFRVWRMNGEGEQYGPVNAVTLKGVLSTLRVFLDFAATIDAVPKGMREDVLLPEIGREEESRDELLEAERALDILEWFDKFRYASREHVILSLLWHTGIRLGSLRALDVEDFDRDEPCLELRHRPNTGTPFKNAKRAERDIAVGEYHAELVSDYIENNRPEVEDEYGREPHISSTQGRLTAVPIRRIVQKWTQPCRIGDCPHDKNPETCEWTQRKKLRDCPSSRSPHGVRGGSITYHRREGVPQEGVSDRMNASNEVLEKHYDNRTKRERMRNRRDFLDNV